MKVVVVIAFIANVLVAVAKTVAAMVTGSASMLAESAHSWADAGNEIFLMVADRKSTKQKDARHPLGYGREAYVWSLFAAFGLFAVGAAVSIMNGINELVAPEPATDFVVAYVVLGIAAILEGASFTQSLLRARATARGFERGTLDFVLNGSNTTLRAVIAEDAAALAGLAIAAAGIAAHQATGDSTWDAAGSIAIGVLLGVVAVVLINRNRRFLVGSVPPSGVRDQVGRALLAVPEVDRVTYLHLEFVGPSRLSVIAAVDLVGDDGEASIARRLRDLEQGMESREFFQSVMLTLSVDDEPSLDFPAASGNPL